MCTYERLCLAEVGDSLDHPKFGDGLIKSVTRAIGRLSLLVSFEDDDIEERSLVFNANSAKNKPLNVGLIKKEG